jgi:hypothetical protein
MGGVVDITAYSSLEPKFSEVSGTSLAVRISTAVLAMPDKSNLI